MQIDSMLEKLIYKLSPVLEVNNFRLTERQANYYRFDSDLVALTIAYNKREDSISVFVGKKDSLLIELDEINLLEVFKKRLKKHNNESYVSSLIEFLISEGLSILKGDLLKLNELEAYSYQRSETYTKNLIKQQYLQNIDKAWNEKDYSAYIRYMDMLDKSSLPRSYYFKYNQAQSKLTKKI